jgi:hypothetical protein
MKCPYCGKELLSQAVICDGCGAKVGNSEEPEQNTNNQQNIENIYQPQNSNNKSGILVLFLFLAGIVVVSYFLFFTGGSSGNESNNEEQANIENNSNTNTDNGNTVNTLKYQKYLETANAFVSAVRTDVNMGRNLRFYDTSAIYLLPVGNNKDCGVLESGGSSPLGGDWNYAFVEVTYDGKGYTYYYISEDSNLNGITLTPALELSNNNISKIYNGHNGNIITDDISNKLKELYNTTENKTYSNELPEELTKVLTPENEQKNKFILISGNSCKSS